MSSELGFICALQDNMNTNNIFTHPHPPAPRSFKPNFEVEYQFLGGLQLNMSS